MSSAVASVKTLHYKSMSTSNNSTQVSSTLATLERAVTELKKVCSMPLDIKIKIFSIIETIQFVAIYKPKQTQKEVQKSLLLILEGFQIPDFNAQLFLFHFFYFSQHQNSYFQISNHHVYTADVESIRNVTCLSGNIEFIIKKSGFTLSEDSGRIEENSDHFERDQSFGWYREAPSNRIMQGQWLNSDSHDAKIYGWVIGEGYEGLCFAGGNNFNTTMGNFLNTSGWGVDRSTSKIYEGQFIPSHVLVTIYPNGKREEGSLELFCNDYIRKGGWPSMHFSTCPPSPTKIGRMKTGWRVVTDPNKGTKYAGLYKYIGDEACLYLGIQYYEDGRTPRYVGYFELGMRNGKGILYSRDGSVRVGEWLDDEPKGPGFMKDINGMRFEEYLNGRTHRLEPHQFDYDTLKNKVESMLKEIEEDQTIFNEKKGTLFSPDDILNSLENTLPKDLVYLIAEYSLNTPSIK